VANQNFKPFVEGIIPTIICGDLAGKTASEYLRGKGSLERYTGRVKAKLGTFFAESDELIPSYTSGVVHQTARSSYSASVSSPISSL
jgi:flavin-dependent dehydrogenase